MSAITPPQYHIGNALITSGDKITHIIGETDRAGVYLIQDDRIRWEYYAEAIPPSHAKQAVESYEALWFTITASIRQKYRHPLILQLANSLFSGLHADDEKAVEECFKIVDERIHYRARVNQSLRYLLGCATIVVVTAITTDLLSRSPQATPSWDVFLFSANAGGVGALISVLQRLSALQLHRFAPMWYAFLEGIARVLLGVLFALFFVLANKANLLLGSFSDSLDAILAFSVVAGISERFVPELIRTLENSAIKVPRKKA